MVAKSVVKGNPIDRLMERASGALESMRYFEGSIIPMGRILIG